MTIFALNTSTGASAPALVRLISGEYTAASVVADPKDATRLWLVRQSDGNYDTALAVGSAVAHSSSTVLASLDSLRLGGA